MRNLWTYLRERFPLPLVLLLSLSFACISVGLFSPAETGTGQWWSAIGLLTLAYLALLLRYRVTDEWKDFAHDNAAYPGRPVQRGVIGVRGLSILGIAALAAELSSVILLGGTAGLFFYLPVFVLSALTAVEFFAGSWLSRHFTVSFVLHELIYLPLFVWAAVAVGAALDLRTLLGVVAATAVFVAIEIVRKLEPRRNPRGEIVADTYTAVWGRTAAMVVLVLSLLIGGILASFATGSAMPGAVAAVVVVAIAAATRSTRTVMVLGGIGVPALAAVTLL